MSRHMWFRAWDGETMHGPFSIEIMLDAIHDPGGYTDLLNLSQDIEWTQYTGFTDAKDKSIYEGDIIKFGKDDEIVGWGEVYFDNGCFKHTYQEWFYNTENDEWEPERNSWRPTKRFFVNNRVWIQVIGNIYQNPELLKDTNGREIDKQF